jgi:hypothetical protein
MKRLVVLRDLVLVILIEHLFAFGAGLIGVESKSAGSQWFHCLALIAGLTIVACLSKDRPWRRLGYVSLALWLLSLFDVLVNRRPWLVILQDGLVIGTACLCSGGLSMLLPRKAEPPQEGIDVGARARIRNWAMAFVSIAAIIYYLWFLWRGIDR